MFQLRILVSSIKKYWLATTLFILAFITVMSLYPLAELPPIPGTDKTHHLIAYGLLMMPVAVKNPKNMIAIALFFAFWSGAIEILQPYVNRYAEFKDFLANVAGLILGWVIVKVVKKIISKE